MVTISLLSSLLILLFVLSAFCSSSETVFFSLNPIDVRRHSQAHPQSGKRIRGLLSKPRRLLSAIIIVNTLANISASSLSYEMAVKVIPRYAERITIPLMTVLLLLFAEFGPKRLGLMHTHTLARLYGPILQLLVWVTTPLRRGLEMTSHLFEPVFRIRGRILSDEEFKTVVDVSENEGVINTEEWAMIKAIIDLENLRVSDVMTPRVDVRGIDLSSQRREVVSIARETRLHYLLLYRKTPDEIEGFLDIRRFLLDPEHRLREAVVSPGYIPESLALNRLMQRFIRGHRRIAAVVDEYGGLAGVITRGDILETISGDVYDELLRPHPVFQEVEPGRWLVDPSVNLEEFNRKLNVELQADGVDRLSGWIASKLGRLPECGDTVESPPCRVTVLRTEKLRVTLAEIEKDEALV